MTGHDPNADSFQLRAVLESAAALLDFVAEEMDEGGLLTKGELAELPRCALVLVSRACRRTAEEEGARLEELCESLVSRGVGYGAARETEAAA